MLVKNGFSDLGSGEGGTNKYVLFKIKDDLFGVPVENVSHIKEVNNVYPVPKAPSYIPGLVDYFGSIITLINLRKRLCIKEEREETFEKGKVVFLELNKRNFGIIVDEIIALSSIQISEIKQTVTTTLNRAFVKGTVMVEEGLVILLDLDNVLSDFEPEEIDEQNKTVKS